MKEDIKRVRMRVLDKLITNGYDTDDKLSKLKLEDLILNSSFTRMDLEIAVSIRNALINKNIISFISGNEKEAK